MEQTSTPKLKKLQTYIADKGRDGTVVAFSGGVDSTVLAAFCHQILAEKAIAVITQSATYTSEELQFAKKTAQTIGIPLYIIQTNELENKNFQKNPPNRCYYCKKERLQKLFAFAHSHNLKTIFEGTNLTDLQDHRPGIQAIQETPNVYSPWIACQFTKTEIRETAKILNLNVQDKPSASCLATRIPFNQPITIEKLYRINQAEQDIKSIVPIRQLRVRDHDGLARIEVGIEDQHLFFDKTILDKVVLALKQRGFLYVTFDLEGYQTGSMLRAPLTHNG
ncbi:MAG: ATP-dependent sacrificial sulfur transferase LarE [Nitrososphaerota archaeon]|jgi:uncharacterized protein|nr:ATP-dependent sacrificial sulfur transferase LarE [Nitrososphaerota archaeon]